MHYFAKLNTNYVCTSVFEVDDETYNQALEWGSTYEGTYCIRISSLDTSLVYRKKYIDGEWVDALPSESNLIKTEALVHKYGADDKFLSETIGELATLTTTNKDNLVAAINELKAAVDALTTIE